MKNKTKKLPNKTLKLIDDYIGLKIGNKKIRTPYYQNYLRKKHFNNVFIGKGLPKEIEIQTLDQLKKVNKNPDKISKENLRYFMIMCDIGIDCSGFVMRVLESYLKESHKKNLREVIKPNNGLLNNLRDSFRFYSNLSANRLTSAANTKNIDLSDAMPADMIRFGPGHVGIITEVHYKNDSVEKIIFAHSTTDYFEKSGVRKEEIKITNLKKPLEKQKWEKLGSEYFSKQDYLIADANDRGIRRLML